MPANIHSIGAITIVVDGNPSVTLPVEQWGFSASILESVHFHSGNMAPTFIAVPGANPRIFVTLPFLIAFQTFGLGVGTVTAMSAFISKFQDFVRDQGDPVSTRISLAVGAVGAAQIVGWSVGVDGLLYANVEIVGLSNANGDTAPFTFTDGVTLPALSGSPVLHTLGPVELVGTAPADVIPGLSGHSGSINGNLDVRRSDGDRYPRIAARYQINPTINLQHADPVAFIDAIGVLGLALTGAIRAVAYFRRFDPTTGVVDASNGVSITINYGRVTYSGVDNSNGAISTTSLTVTGIVADGDSNPLVIATGVLVPTPP